LEENTPEDLCSVTDRLTRQINPTTSVMGRMYACALTAEIKPAAEPIEGEALWSLCAYWYRIAWKMITLIRYKMVSVPVSEKIDSFVGITLIASRSKMKI